MSVKSPLGGIDVFHWMNDRGMRSRGLPGNHCLLVAELEGRLDPGALEARIARAFDLVPELSLRVARWPVWPLHWEIGPRPSAPLVRVRETPTGELTAALLEDLLAERVDGRRPWAIDLVRTASRDAVVLRWFHSLVDAKGAERLVRWLGAGGAEGPPPPPREDERWQRAERVIAKRDRRERLEAMKAYNRHVMQLGDTPILSPASAHPAPTRRDGMTRALRVHLTEEKTRAFARRVRERARLAETSVMLLCSARAVDALLVGRGYAPPRYAVPLPLSLDPKAGSERMMGNNLTMMMFALDRAALADEARAIADLADQQRAIVREKLDTGMIAALDFARWLPPHAYRFLSTRPFHGEMASFIFSNPGALTLEEFAGVPVRDAYPLPAVVSPPGIQLTFTRFRGRVSAFVAWVDGDVSAAEGERVAARLEAELAA